MKKRVRTEYQKQYREKHKEKATAYQKNYHKENKESISLNQQRYYAENVERIKLQKKQYYNENIEHILSYNKQYRTDNKDLLKLNNKKYREENRELLKLQHKQYYASIALYETYAHKLTIDESPILANDGISMEVKCKYCGKYFSPTNSQVGQRLGALEGRTYGSGSLYCSDGCKQLCPIFKQIKYPKDLKPTTSREVNPLVRKLCFEADEWECQRCGSTESLICHHILGYAQYKTLSNDLANVITFCETCHNWVHSFPGCRRVDLRCDLKEEEE